MKLIFLGNTIAVSVYSGCIYIIKDKKLLKQFIETEAKRVSLSSNKIAIYSIDRILIRSIEDDLFIRYKYWVNNKMNYNSYIAKLKESGYKLYRMPSGNSIYPYVK